eukprot:1102476-Alexandrium_andersonii.AAC.1
MAGRGPASSPQKHQDPTGRAPQQPRARRHKQPQGQGQLTPQTPKGAAACAHTRTRGGRGAPSDVCLLYTSDAADDM